MTGREDQSSETAAAQQEKHGDRLHVQRWDRLRTQGKGTAHVRHCESKERETEEAPWHVRNLTHSEASTKAPKTSVVERIKEMEAKREERKWEFQAKRDAKQNIQAANKELGFDKIDAEF